VAASRRRRRRRAGPERGESTAAETLVRRDVFVPSEMVAQRPDGGRLLS
jgi:hypothetical protein